MGGDVGGKAGHVLACERDRAPLGLDQAADALQQRRLAGAVGSEQGDDLALDDVEVDTEEDLHGPVRHVDSAALEQRLAAPIAVAVCHGWRDVRDGRDGVHLAGLVVRTGFELRAALSVGPEGRAPAQRGAHRPAPTGSSSGSAGSSGEASAGAASPAVGVSAPRRRSTSSSG